MEVDSLCNELSSVIRRCSCEGIVWQGENPDAQPMSINVNVAVWDDLRYAMAKQKAQKLPSLLLHSVHVSGK